MKELPFGVLSILYIEENPQGERLKTRGEKTRAKKARLNELGIKKYSILETEVDIAEGYGRQLIKIDTIKG